MTRHATPVEVPIATAETATMKAEIDGLKAQLDLMREALDDAKKERTAWQKQAEGSQRLLADERPRRSWLGLGRAS